MPPDHAAGEPLTAAEVRQVAAAICGVDELCVGLDQAYTDIRAAIDAAASGQIIQPSTAPISPFLVTAAV